MFNLNTALLTAGFGSITLFWGYLKNIFHRISSILIVSAEVEGSAGSYLLMYLWDNFKCSRIGDRRFSYQNRFLRSKDKIWLFPTEILGSNLTFWSKFKPLFVSSRENKEGRRDMGTVKISFLRGTFDIEKLLIESHDAISDKMHDRLESNGGRSDTNRFSVRKIFGRNRARNNQNSSAEQSSPSSGSDIRLESLADNDWKPIGVKREDIGHPIPDSPFENLHYDESVKEFELEIRRWKNSEDWYKSKGLNWRFGGGIFGPPGTGKSSFVRAIGQDLDMPIHIYDLVTMNNEDLVRAWKDSLNASPCIVLLEDIDRIFDQDKNVKASDLESGITLDCLLNCISGVEPSNGILTLITANDPSKMDSALGTPDSSGTSTRPGRLDRAVFFGTLSEKSRTEIAKRILSDCPQHIDELVREGVGETGAQFESRCSRVALREYWGGFKVYGSEKMISIEDKSEFSVEQ